MDEQIMNSVKVTSRQTFSPNDCQTRNNLVCFMKLLSWYVCVFSAPLPSLPMGHSTFQCQKQCYVPESPTFRLQLCQQRQQVARVKQPHWWQQRSACSPLGTAMAWRKPNQTYGNQGSTWTPLQLFKKQVCAVSVYPKILLLNKKVCLKKYSMEKCS